MTGSTPIERKIFVSAIKELTVVSAPAPSSKAEPTPPEPTDELNTDCGDRTLPATGRRARPLITFLLFILQILFI
jgi:hypothetical protein